MSVKFSTAVQLKDEDMEEAGNSWVDKICPVTTDMSFWLAIVLISNKMCG